MPTGGSTFILAFSMKAFSQFSVEENRGQAGSGCLTKVKIGNQDSKLTHQLGSQGQNPGEWGSTEKLPRLLTLIKSLADSSAKYGRPYG